MNKDPHLFKETSHRLLEPVSVDLTLINRALAALNLTCGGSISVPEEGRIASNVCIETHELGQVLLRFYPPGCQDEKVESGNVDFEIEALHYLASHRVPVPKPLAFGENQYIWEDSQIKMFAYQLLPGKCLKMKDLSVDIAKKCGILLTQMIDASSHFKPHDTVLAPQGDIEYILSIYQILLQRYPQLSESVHLQEIAAFAKAVMHEEILKNTPKGIVHADFFFENILYNKDTGKLSVIDFGDAYYGYVIMDIVIGAMEFCVTEDKTWNLEMFASFITPHTNWLKEHHISFDSFHKLLMANCLRFAIYTMPTTLEANDEVMDNPYVTRFYHLKKPELRQSLERAYYEIMQ